ncbi:hypothetical protein SAMN04488570_0251 [Nocardioides scoriae]|uniref:Uncharacterized protein n=1 Tax=Nocardioides scoriae TaxID=642780 RepID=A0A1H1LK11_9ACTN|nr:hypothetical protein [Nocardioides scoriae]SDR74876.1 hypothetical protein SAMN04488570_0251 [Nocardioides scoriae]
MVTREYRPFRAGDRPGVEVQIGDAWLAGELRAWIRRAGIWWAHLDYTLPDRNRHTTTVPSRRVRSTDPRGQVPVEDDDAGTSDAGHISAHDCSTS